MSDTTIPTNFEEAEAILAETLPGYESREPQQRLARLVEDSIQSKTHLLGQAGCGTGKSLGYLIPAITSGKRVIVSTGTKALQDQIATKDLPFLAEHLPNKFSHAVLKGKNNYLCRQRLAEREGAEAEEIKVFLSTKPDISGERNTLPEVSDETWSNLTVSSDDCAGKECPFYQQCFAEKAKNEAQGANVVVVNHALLCTDALVGGRVLGKADALVVDEAHELPDWAAKTWGARLTLNGLKALGDQAASVGNSSDGRSQATALYIAAQEIFENLPEHGEKLTAEKIKEYEDQWGTVLSNLVFILSRVEHEFNSLDVDDRKARAKLQRLLNLSESAALKVNDIKEPTTPNIVRWVEEETSAKGTTYKIVRTAPVEVGGLLHQRLWQNTPSVLVSATIGEFDFAARESGLNISKNYRTLDVGSPFDFSKQGRLYVPERLPILPKKPTKAQEAQRQLLVQEEIVKLIEASKGRTLVLFTSVQRLRETVKALRPRLPYTVYAQGEAPNKELAEAFASEIDSCLFATRSFFTGVDFQGETCSTVIIEKLPFPVPTEPVISAKSDAIERRGGKPFYDLLIPVTSILLQQAVGRLIRTKSDRGVVAILDSRLAGEYAKGYGNQLVQDLPDLPLISSIEEVEAFFEEETS